ncbi:MAG: aspartate aminotransferase family protein [Chloroflexota bacterium]|nr:aspartate aminotransferase family protein [Chloroflexota bacterium]
MAIALHPVMQMENDYVVQAYKRAPFVLTHGQGMMLYDSDGKAYQDWAAGIAVNALGYGDPGLIETIQKAATGLIHTSNLYYTEPQAALAARLCELSFADRAFFCNSGAEAVEGAIKFVRRYHYDNADHDRTEIVCFTNAFHGRTFGALSLTPKEKYQKPFSPLMPDVKVVAHNDIAAADAAITTRTAAVIIEPVQGEGGIRPASNEFLQALRRFCDERGALLIFDQIQCGMGRTGTLWSSEPSGVTPDIQTLAKPLAGGLPIGAILTTEKVASHIHPGDHGTTFGGGAFITTVAHYVLDRIADPAFLQHVSETGAYLKERLQEINSPLIKEVRGRGLMLGIELTIDVSSIVDAGYEHGLLLINAGTDTIRFVPPLIAQKSDVDALIEKLEAILTKVSQ